MTATTKEDSSADIPEQSPYYHARNAQRYDRQQAIVEYQSQFDCRLVVMIAELLPESVTHFEELVYDADPNKDLHIMLASPGGDGETAVRLIRSAQARCQELTFIIPDQAKSAATLMTLGAHHILMGPASDLGPIDPQFPLRDGSWASAKNIIDAVEYATEEVQKAPATYPIHATLLGDVNALLLQRAFSAMERTEDLLEEALRSNPSRSDEETEKLKASLSQLLINLPQSHSALFSVEDANKAGLPVRLADVNGTQWRLIWRLWTKYFALEHPGQIYEGERVSLTFPASAY